MFIHMEELELTRQKLVLSADVEDIIRKKAVPIGNGAHVTCPKEYLGRTVYLVVCKK
jgi:putative transposon-encoded protein